MTAASVLNQIATYFGGSYDSLTRSYRTPQIAGLGVVRRQMGKRLDKADYYLGQVGTGTGAILIVHIVTPQETRIAVAGPSSGIKRVTYPVWLQFLVASAAPYAEDAQDAAYALYDAAVARLRADRTCGSGGFEAGGFQVGEGSRPLISTGVAAARSSAEETKVSLLTELAAVELVYA